MYVAINIAKYASRWKNAESVATSVAMNASKNACVVLGRTIAPNYFVAIVLTREQNVNCADFRFVRDVVMPYAAVATGDIVATAIKASQQSSVTNATKMHGDKSKPLLWKTGSVKYFILCSIETRLVF